MKRYSISVIIGLMICYEIGVKIVQKPIILPSLTLIFSELIRIILSSSFVIIIQATLLRAMLTYLFVFMISLVLGIISGYFNNAYFTDLVWKRTWTNYDYGTCCVSYFI